MKTKMMQIGLGSCMAMALALASVAGAEEHKDHKDHKDHKEHEGKMTIPDTAAGVMAGVNEHIKELDDVVAAGKLGEVHEHAFAVRDLLVALPEKMEHLPADVSTSLETSLGKIRQQAELLDKYGDAGNAAQTKAVLGKFKAEIDGIQKLTADHMAAAGDGSDKGVKMAANKTCPISGSEVGSMEKDAHVDYGGYRVGLCCSGCISKFNKDPDANLKKALGQSK